MRSTHDQVRTALASAYPLTVLVSMEEERQERLLERFGKAAKPNPLPLAVWTVWWAGLIFAVAVLGPAFCFACPWDGLANLATRLRLAARETWLNRHNPQKLHRPVGLISLTPRAVGG